jgi:predicted NACHT family NTPase
MALSSNLGTPGNRSHTVVDLSGLISTILGFGTSTAKDKLQRHELVIKLLKKMNLDPDHPPADFTAVYQYALVEYGIGKPKPVLEIFRQSEIQQIFRKALDQNNAAILLQEGEKFLAGHALGDELQALGMSARREFYEFAAVFIEIAKRTRTPAEVLTNQRLESLHQQIDTMQERLNRLPTLEGIRTEMARLAEQDLLALPASAATNTARQCRAFALAQQMRGWFETLGYRFEKDEVWQDDYFEWMINVPVRRNRFDRILVRGIEGEAGLGDVRLLRQAVETQKADEGWLVTARRISRAARDEAEKPENRHLDCYTFDELVDLDADFSGYIEWLESEIQQRGIETKYVPIACTKEDLDPVTKHLLTVSRYDERDGWIDGYIDRWLDDFAKEHISVLGEFGTGKTWFAFHYAWMALKRYQEAKERGTQRPRLPLVITLRDYAKALNVENVLAGFFFTQHNIRLNSEVFDQLNRMGKLLLIFDGFDEMAAKVDKQQMINNFWELAKVVVPGAKVILTCRTEHFPKAQDGRALLNAELKASTANLTGETPQFEVLELEKFTDDQIRQVLSFQSTPATVEQVMGNPQLLDLARRPVMTELILEALPDIEAGKPVDMSRVYLYSVRRKMERDIKAERTFTSLADKLYFLCELSWEMLSTDQMSLNYRLFPDRIRKLFGAMVQKEKDLDHWQYDMMGQTMLIRNADGDYAPAHRSLLEFFTAYKFAAELGALAPDFLALAQMQSHIDVSTEPKDYTWSEYFQSSEAKNSAIIPAPPLKDFASESIKKLRQTVGQSPLSKAIIDLLLPMLKDWKSDSTHIFLDLLKSLSHKDFSNVGYVPANAATLSVEKDKAALEGLNLSHSVIKGANFAGAILHKTDFSYSDLEGSEFTQPFSMLISLKFSPRNNCLAVGDTRGNIWLLSTKSYQISKILEGHTAGIRYLDFSPNGEFIASGSLDKTVKLWKTDTGECLRTFCGHDDIIWSVVFSPDSQVIASGSADTTAKLWQVESGECFQTYQHDSTIYSLTFDLSGKILITGSEDGIIRFFRVADGQEIKIINAHKAAIRSLSVNTDGLTFISGSNDQTVRLWNINTGESLRAFQGHEAEVRSVSFSPNKQILASSSNDRTIKLWHINTAQPLKSLEGHTTWVLNVAFNYDGTYLASCCHDQTVKIWNTRTGKCIRSINGYSQSIACLAINADGNLIASESADLIIKIWNVDSAQCVNSFKAGDSWIYSLSFSSDGKYLAVGCIDNSIKLWDLQTNQCLKVLHGHQAPVSKIFFHDSSDLMFSQDWNGIVKIWFFEEIKCVETFQAFSEKNLFLIGSDGKISDELSSQEETSFWELNLNEGMEILQAMQSTDLNRFNHTIALSLDKNFIASAFQDDVTGLEKILVWSTLQKTVIKTIILKSPYEGMNITGIKGLTEAEKSTLKALGAIEIKN